MLNKIPFKVEVAVIFKEWCLKWTYSGFTVYIANILDETTTLVCRVIEECWPFLEQTTNPDIIQLPFCVKLDLLHKWSGHYRTVHMQTSVVRPGSQPLTPFTDLVCFGSTLLKSNISQPLSRFAFIHLSEAWSSAPKKSCLYQHVLIFL